MITNFSDFAQQFAAGVSAEHFAQFAAQPNVIQIVAQTRAQLIQKIIPELSVQESRVKQLSTDEEVFSAACVVYFYSTDAVMDILDSYPQYSYCTYLSKLLLQQTVLQLPLSLYSAFSVVLIKLLECDELKKIQDDLPLVNSTLANLNFEKAYNEVESQKIVCTLLRDICARFYTIINGSTIEICCKFLDLQEDYPKLIELCSLRYFMNKFTQKEQKVADTAYQYFKNHYQHCVNAR